MTARLRLEADVLHVEGRIGADNADAVCAEGERLLAGQPVGRIDLAALESASTLVAAVLLRWARAAAARGQALRLANVPDKCRAIIAVSGLAEAFGLSG